MKVLAKKGTKCPKENNPRDYIADDVAEEVPDSVYYLRLVADGSLKLEGTAPSPPAPLPQGEGGQSPDQKTKGGKR